MGTGVVRLITESGARVEFVEEVIGAGAMKDVYFSPDRSYVVAFFRDKLDYHALERLRNIVGSYRERIFTGKEGDYWIQLFCWPSDLVRWQDRWGVVCPTYDAQFFFRGGTLDGKEKEGKWFASARHRKRMVPKEELGDWRRHIQMCVEIARAVKRLHALGLAHSDLSYKNILVNPSGGHATIIDCDGLVVRGKYPPDVVGTPDFIAPEVVRTQRLNPDDPQRVLPSITTDRHALAVLVYMYLLYRHPLRGGKVWHIDAERDEELSMGEKALFIEHPTIKANRPNLAEVHPAELPQADVEALPCDVCGRELKSLFIRSFVDGLHAQAKRPTADEWEQALLRTLDLTLPCSNADCEYGWFVFDHSAAPSCPFCGEPYHGKLAILNFYYSPRPGKFIPEGTSMVVHASQTMHAWHVNRYVSASNAMAGGDGNVLIAFYEDASRWMLRNVACQGLHLIADDGSKRHVAKGKSLELEDAQKLLLSNSDGGRLVVVQLVHC